MENPKFQIYKDTKGDYRFRLYAKNGEMILHASEGYASKQGCQTGIASVKANAPHDARYDRRISSNSQCYFVLKGANGEIIGMSEMYYSTSGRDNGINAVKRDAPGAPTEDLTVSQSNTYRW